MNEDAWKVQRRSPKQRLFAESVCGRVVFAMIGAAFARKLGPERSAIGILVVLVESFSESVISKVLGQCGSRIESAGWRWRARFAGIQTGSVGKIMAAVLDRARVVRLARNRPAASLAGSASKTVCKKPLAWASAVERPPPVVSRFALRPV